MEDVQVEVPDDAVVIRFRPTDPERVLASAEKEHRRTGRYGCSVFAVQPFEGETESQVIARLLAAADLVGMTVDRHNKYWVCTRAKELLTEGFTFCKDGDDDELPEHYSVVLGAEPTIEDAERFLSAFSDARRR